MVEPEPRAPVGGLQDRLKETCKVHKHVAHQKEPAGGRERKERIGDNNLHCILTVTISWYLCVYIIITVGV